MKKLELEILRVYQEHLMLPEYDEADNVVVGYEDYGYATKTVRFYRELGEERNRVALYFVNYKTGDIIPVRTWLQPDYNDCNYYGNIYEQDYVNYLSSTGVKIATTRNS